MFKVAQINHLVTTYGCTVDEAAVHLKQAEEADAERTIEMAKAAAVSALVAEGTDINTAVQCVNASAANILGF